MSAVPVYIVGTITTAAPKSGEVDPSGIKQCVIHGLASIEGLTVGGGPIIPPTQPPVEPPWGGVDKPPVVGHPIWPPYVPGHPLPDPPNKPPTEPPVGPPTNPPSIDWSWVWNPSLGWHPAYVAGDKPQPPH